MSLGVSKRAEVYLSILKEAGFDGRLPYDEASEGSIHVPSSQSPSPDFHQKLSAFVPAGHGDLTPSRARRHTLLKIIEGQRAHAYSAYSVHVKPEVQTAHPRSMDQKDRRILGISETVSKKLMFPSRDFVHFKSSALSPHRHSLLLGTFKTDDAKSTELLDANGMRPRNLRRTRSVPAGFKPCEYRHTGQKTQKASDPNTNVSLHLNAKEMIPESPEDYLNPERYGFHGEQQLRLGRALTLMCSPPSRQKSGKAGRKKERTGRDGLTDSKDDVEKGFALGGVVGAIGWTEFKKRLMARKEAEACVARKQVLAPDATDAADELRVRVVVAKHRTTPWLLENIPRGGERLLGRAVVKELADAGFQVIGTAFSRASASLEKLDLRDPKAIEEFLEKHRPAALIHCAAERRPDVAERDREGARRLNVESAKAVASAAKKVGAWHVYISTDYVFDGKNPPYETTDAANPLNFYGISCIPLAPTKRSLGETKYDGELATAVAYPDAGILRVPVLYGEVEDPSESAVNILLPIVKGKDNSKKAVMDDFQSRFPTK
ncbi:Methionine adenosyltransferase 2 subunit beta [Phlyctochytrium bullatum]|nr:Methionine adenosyltransferase 2 subunit beta [Phlyctochytrium bullatum]